MAFAFWESGGAVDDWLETHLDIVERKPSSGNNYKWPYIEFIIDRHGPYVCARRVEEVFENGELRSIKRGSPIPPGKLLAEVKLKPSGEERDALQRVADALHDLKQIAGDSDDFLRIPASMVGFTLFAAVRYKNSILLLEKKFSRLSLLPEIEARFEWHIDESKCEIRLAGIPNGHTFWRSIPPVHVTDGGEFARVKVPDGKSINEMIMLDAMPKLPIEDMPDAYEKIIRRFPDFPLGHPTSDEALVDLDHKRLTFVLRFPKEHNYKAQLLFRYYRGVELDDHGPYTSISKKHGKTYRIARDIGREQQAIRLLSSMGLHKLDTEQGLVFGAGHEMIKDARDGNTRDPAFWADFFETVAPKLRENGWRIFPPKDGPDIVDCADVDASFGDSDEVGTFRLNMATDIDGERIAILPLVLKLLERYDYGSMHSAFERAGEYSHLAVNEKRLLRMPTERLKAVVQMVQNSIDVMTLQGNALKLPINRAAEMSLLEKRWGNGIRWTGEGRMRQLIEVFNGFSDPPRVEVPTTIKSTLEPYQQNCVDRAVFLAEHDFPLLICDDMGLGKTLELLSIYAIAKDRDPTIGPALVLAPTTALAQWQSEVKKHCKGIKVAHTGAAGTKDRPEFYERCRNGKIDILVSTYKKAYLDDKLLEEVNWHMIVADEAQAIKGVEAKMRKRIRKLPQTFKYPVTGTPIENGLMDLWALFDVSMPGYLGNKHWFRKNFCDRIEIDQDIEALKRLKALIQPVLRRKRYNDDDVNLNIPAPNIEIVEVPIKGAQRDLYESVRVTQEEKVKELLKRQGIKQATSRVLNAILGMRQIVCDPRTYTMQNHSVSASAKLDRMRLLLDQLHQSGKPTLVFSNFKRMIPKFQNTAEDLGLRHATVTGGDTQRKRENEILRFRRGDADVFFATLGAMNSSVDLYEAKALVLYEPWWNPQKENQGIGRMVRRGQEDDTSVYRLITPNSVEVQLMKIQDRKLALVDSVFNEDAIALTKILTEEDVANLFM